MNVLRPKATAVKCGVTPITIHRWATDEKYAHLNFPRPISLGDNSRGYIEEEVDAFLAERAAAREVVANKIRRWTGFRPSRTSGNARETMTLIE